MTGLGAVYGPDKTVHSWSEDETVRVWDTKKGSLYPDKMSFDCASFYQHVRVLTSLDLLTRLLQNC